MNWLAGVFAPISVPRVYIEKIPLYGQMGGHVTVLQNALVKKGYAIAVDGHFGPQTKKAVIAFQKSFGSAGTGVIGTVTIEKLGLLIGNVPQEDVPPTSGITPKYPSPHRFHPRFKVQAPYTHVHPLDVARSVAGEKEIPGARHNEFIAHLHEHAGNLGVHSDGADYSDEVPHCSSGLNWCADMAGCAKTDNALAASWIKYNVARVGDFVEEGDIIVNGTSHVTLCNKRFNRKTAKTFEGFGFNQSNTIKTSVYSVSGISAVRVWKPLPGTVLAPVGTKAIPATGSIGESTR